MTFIPETCRVHLIRYLRFINEKMQIWQKCPVEDFEDTKGVIRIRESRNDRKHNGQNKKRQKDKQRATKHHTEN